MLAEGAAGHIAVSQYSCVLTEMADVQAQQLIEEWIEEQVIKIDENKYDPTFTSILTSDGQTRALQVSFGLLRAQCMQSLHTGPRS